MNSSPLMLLVILEHENGQLVEAACEALTFGRVLAEKMGEDLEAAIIGSDDDDLVEAAGQYGAETITVTTTFSPITAPTRTGP